MNEIYTINRDPYALGACAIPCCATAQNNAKNESSEMCVPKKKEKINI